MVLSAIKAHLARRALFAGSFVQCLWWSLDGTSRQFSFYPLASNSGEDRRTDGQTEDGRGQKSDISLSLPSSFQVDGLISVIGQIRTLHPEIHELPPGARAAPIITNQPSPHSAEKKTFALYFMPSDSPFYTAVILSLYKDVLRMRTN